MSVENLGVLALKVHLQITIRGTSEETTKEVFALVAPGTALADGILVDFEPVQITLDATGTSDGITTQAKAEWPAPSGVPEP